MADGLIPKTPSLSAMGGRSRKVRSGTTGLSVTQPEREIFVVDLLQMQRQSNADSTIDCDWRQPRTPARRASIGQAAFARFPGRRAGANPCRSTWFLATGA